MGAFAGRQETASQTLSGNAADFAQGVGVAIAAGFAVGLGSDFH